jgi:hypothetical protein
VFGPLSSDEVRHAVASGHLPPGTLVCPVGANTWVKLDDVARLHPSSASAFPVRFKESFTPVVALTLGVDAIAPPPPVSLIRRLGWGGAIAIGVTLGVLAAGLVLPIASTLSSAPDVDPVADPTPAVEQAAVVPSTAAASADVDASAAQIAPTPNDCAPYDGDTRRVCLWVAAKSEGRDAAKPSRLELHRFFTSQRVEPRVRDKVTLLFETSDPVQARILATEALADIRRAPMRKIQ